MAQAKAIDGNFTTFWTVSGLPDWWQYQFPLPVDLLPCG